MELTHEDVVSRLREIHELATSLSRCGVVSVEPRAAEIMAISWALLWSESPFDSPGALLEYE